MNSPALSVCCYSFVPPQGLRVRSIPFSCPVSSGWYVPKIIEIDWFFVQKIKLGHFRRFSGTYSFNFHFISPLTHSFFLSSLFLFFLFFQLLFLRGYQFKARLSRKLTCFFFLCCNLQPSTFPVTNYWLQNLYNGESQISVVNANAGESFTSTFLSACLSSVVIFVAVKSTVV